VQGENPARFFFTSFFLIKLLYFSFLYRQEKETKEAHLFDKSLTRLLALLPSRVAFKDVEEMFYYLKLP